MGDPGSLRRKFFSGVFVLCFLAFSQAQAQQATDEGLGITGLVLNETKTKPGNEFFEFYSIYWKQVDGISYTVHITEQPGRGRGSFIKVLVDDTPVFFENLNPRTEVIEDAAKRASDVTRFVLLRRLNTSKELEGAP
jgi:hypothetical protein